MRLTAEEVKAAILHSDQDVREAAVYYFAKAHSNDPTITPLVIESVNQYGLNAFSTYSFLSDLVHTSASVSWIIHQIEHFADGSNEHEERIASASLVALIRCNPVLLKQHSAAIQSMTMLDEAIKREISDRIAIGSMTAEQRWAELRDFCGRMDDDESFSSDAYNHARYLAVALGPDSDQFGQHIIEYLRDPEKCGGWLEVFLVIAAGEMKLKATVPNLADYLKDCDTYACQEAHHALEKIGGDVVVRELATRYVQDDDDVQLALIAILENIHTDSSVQACVDFLAAETDEFLRGFLLEAILANFDSAGIEPARQHVLRNEKSPEVLEVRNSLLVACKLLGLTFDEFEAWRNDSLHDGEFRRQWYKDHPLGQIDDDDDLDESDFDDDFDDEEPDDYLDQFGNDEATEVEDSPPTTIRRAERVGRNDPCPCGSGKKYKKCCYGKARIVEETDTGHASALGSLQASSVSRRYPIGTIALYGPNESVTTKVAASVIKHEHAEPIVERWVGTNVLINPKVQRQIKSLFEKHRVKNVVQTEGNIGCPHEEGLDFPVGEDCPFCPHWAGKQGTARKD